MRVLIGAMIVMCTASFAAAQFVDYKPSAKPKPTKIGLTQEQFETIKSGLEKNSASAVEGVAKDREAGFALRDLQYDKATWEMVKKYLETIDKLKLPGVKKMEAYHRAYIICRLLEPLVGSKPEVIREALPTVRKIEEQYRNAYIPFPNWTKVNPAVLKNCKMPANVPVGPTRLDLLDKVDKARQQKVLAEQPTIIAAESIGSIEQTYACMMAFAGDPNEDAKLVQWIDTNEKMEAKNHVWTMAVEAINSEAGAGTMSKDRAKALVALMRQMVEEKAKLLPVEMRTVKAKPTDYEYVLRYYKAAYTPEPSPDDNSKTITWRWEYTGYVLLTSIKWLDMAANGITDPTKSTMVVRNPHKSNKEKFGNDKEYWDASPQTNKTKKETPPPGYDGVVP